VRVGQRYEPDPRAAAVYDTQYPLYQELYAVYALRSRKSRA
jgi:sugar (pentulose or hexulose) kinase